MEVKMVNENKILDDFTDEDEVKSENNIFYNFSENPEVIGFFARYEKDNYGQHAVLKTADDEEIHLPNLTALNGKLTEVTEGQKVKVVHLGEKKSNTGRVYQDFKVMIKTE